MLSPSNSYRWITMKGSSGSDCENDEIALDRSRGSVLGSSGNDISLRHWLDKPERSVNDTECLHVFKQIVEIVNVAHAQGINALNIRPSCFVMSSSCNHVSFIESASCSDSSSDSFHGHEINPTDTSQIVSETGCIQSSSVNTTRVPSVGDENKIADSKIVEPDDEEQKQLFPMKQILLMETTWYTSPEVVAGASSCCASDIYQLGVLLFELFCPCSSREEKSRTMSTLRHRVLPPQLLLKWPKEASFCLWLLHPEPSSRPPVGELLQSEFLNEARVNLEERESAIELQERLEEHDLLLEFLSLMQQRNQEASHKLQKTISLLSFDIEEILKIQSNVQQREVINPDMSNVTLSESDSDLPSVNIFENEDSANLGTRKRFRPGGQICNTARYDESIDESRKPDTHAGTKEKFMSKSSRIMKNFEKLEATYFLARMPPLKPPSKHSSVSSEASNEQHTESKKNGWMNPFLEGLCKYLAFDSLKVKANLKQGDLLNSSNLVCSLSFDRDGEYFATAGVNKKIKVFEFEAILNEDRDIHYPLVEMGSNSRLSSICWNTYIKSQIASSNLAGIVELWDVTRNEILMEMKEHERRVWSIDFSSADPTMLASGSDDCSIKLWSINQSASVGTIKAKANVCCVQFSPDSGRYLAFGSADHKIYYYDLRHSKIPLCTLNGHRKTVSYVKFVDSMNLVSASTDNTLKLWDLSTFTTSSVIDTPLRSFTGHVNVKNFVGMSVSDGYIATGSETNEVFVYHKAFPMPALSYKFNTVDPLSGHEMDDASQFISSVCWRGHSSSALVAANSTGNIKILEMV